jgi:hypothetical protein
MNWKRAVLLGILLWVIIFFEVSILMFGFKLNAPQTSYYVLHGVLITIFYVLVSLYYFSGKVKRGVSEGIVLSIVLIIVELVLDSIITIPLFIIPNGGSYSSFLLSKEMLLSYLWFFIIACAIGGMKKK